MAQKKQKYYVVWNGRKTGIFTTWEEAKAQVYGYKNPLFKSFTTLEEAEQRFAEGYQPQGKDTETEVSSADEVVRMSIAVDAACSGNPGKMEYRGVSLWDNKEIFHKQFQLGTNNIGEFLAIVHALALLYKEGIDNVIIYSDSRIAINWVKSGQCRTKLEYTPFTAELFDVVRRAEAWLANNDFRVPIIKWPTEKWGEIPADFGRK